MCMVMSSQKPHVTEAAVSYLYLKKRKEQSHYEIVKWKEDDIKAIPTPDPETTIISTISRFRLKYCPTMRVDASRLRPTPTPEIEVKWHSIHSRLRNWKWKQFAACIITDKPPITEEQLVKLRRKWAEKTPKGCQKSSKNAGQPCTFRFAERHPNRG